MLEIARSVIYPTSDLVWGWWTVALLLGTGLFLSVRFRFAQVTRMGEAFRLMRRRDTAGAEEALSPLQAFMTGLAGSVGMLRRREPGG